MPQFFFGKLTFSCKSNVEVSIQGKIHIYLFFSILFLLVELPQGPENDEVQHTRPYIMLWKSFSMFFLRLSLILSLFFFLFFMSMDNWSIFQQKINNCRINKLKYLTISLYHSLSTSPNFRFSPNY